MIRIFVKSTLITGILLIFIAIPIISEGQTRVRTDIKIPDIPGYRTLKCDFHIHTVFSDGKVWPTIRAEEAWRQGLDAIAITDHIEYLPHKEDMQLNHNRSAEIAKSHGEDLNITVISGSEITRDMPPGHLNAIFLKDASKLDTDTWRQAVGAANEQGAFVFWNHPGWRSQQPDGIAKWYDEHTELLNKNQLHGIEVVNEKEYYPEAHRWCLEKNLTMFSNSDIHDPVRMFYNIPVGEHRPLTLVFAKKNSVKQIKNALFAQRTAVYWNNTLIGKEEFLEPIFYNSLHIENPSISLTGDEKAYVQITNLSEIDYKLEINGEAEDLKIPSNITLYGQKTVLLEVQKKDKELIAEKKIPLPYKVNNLKITPDETLAIFLELELDMR